MKRRSPFRAGVKIYEIYVNDTVYLKGRNRDESKMYNLRRLLTTVAGFAVITAKANRRFGEGN